jgi:glucokinase
MPGWVNIPLRDAVAEATKLPVVLGNDANAAALGEWRFGGGVGRQHMVYITVSTGIGSGIIVDGRLVEGRYGCGGELGLMVFDPVSRASWEDLASGTGLARAARRTMGEHPASFLHSLSEPATVRAQHVAQAAAQGDGLARSLMEREAELLGLGFASIMHIFSPEIILVGGSVVTENPYLLDQATAVMRERVVADIYRDVPVQVAALGSRAGLLGAVALVLYARESRG